MLDSAGSNASILGVFVSVIALTIAIYQIIKLRGEARAAREAAEEAQRLIRRETTGTDLTRLSERIQGLIYLLRNEDRELALEKFPDIRNLFIDIRRHHPNLNSDHRSRIQDTITSIMDMQNELDASSDGIQIEVRTRFITDLTDFQTNLLVELEDRLG